MRISSNDQAQFSASTLNSPEVRVKSLANADDADILAWGELSRHSGCDSVFACDWFVRPVMHHFDPEGNYLLFQAIDGLGECYGVAVLAPAVRLGRIPLNHWRGLTNANRFMGLPLVRKGRETAFWQALLTRLDSMHDGAAALCFDGLPADHRVTRALRELCTASRRQIEVLATYERAALSDPEDGLVGLSSKREARLRSLERKLVREHGPIEMVRVDSAADVDHWIADFLTLESQGWKGRAGSALAASPATAALFSDVIRDAASRGTIACRSLRVGNRTIAMSSYFISGGHGFGFKCCFDEDYAAYAPGILLLRHIMGEVGTAQVVKFDSCSAPAEPMINNLWGGRRTIVDLCIALKSPVAQARFGFAIAARRMWHRLHAPR